MSQTVKLTQKEKQIRKNVYKELEKMNQYIYHRSYLPIEECVHSFSSSVIIVNDNSSKTSSLEKEVLKIVQDDLNYEKYIKLLSLLSTYDPLLRELIEWKCFMNSTYKNMSYKFMMDRNRISYLCNKACFVLACLDQDIDYTVNDFYSFLNRNHTRNYCIQQIVRLLLIQYDQKTKQSVADIAPIFNILTAEASQLYEKKDVLGVKKFMKIVYCIAYRHPEINFKENDFYDVAKKINLSKREVKKMENLK